MKMYHEYDNGKVAHYNGIRRGVRYDPVAAEAERQRRREVEAYRIALETLYRDLLSSPCESLIYAASYLEGFRGAPEWVKALANEEVIDEDVVKRIIGLKDS